MSGENRTELKAMLAAKSATLPSAAGLPSRTFMCLEADAQSVYDFLFTDKPDRYSVYREDKVDSHIVVTLPVAIPRAKIEVEIVSVKRGEDGAMIAIVAVLDDAEVTAMLQALEPPHILLGNFTGYRIQEAVYMKRMMNDLPGERLAAVACTDPALDDFI